MNEREVARELLRELLDGALAHRGGNGNGDGNAARAGGAPPQVPAPPTAEVLRPSSWQAPAASGGTERVRIGSDADLERFVRALAERFEDPGQRAAARAGRLRFTLGGGRSGGDGELGIDGVLRVDRGAVTERTVARAAKDGARLVLGPRAVLTPLAREKARAAGVEIERERTC